MEEDLSAPYPGYGLGALDAFDGYVSYRILDEDRSPRDRGNAIADRSLALELHITQDLGLGMMLWMSHFFRKRDGRTPAPALSPETLQYVAKEGYFCREPYLPET